MGGFRALKKTLEAPYSTKVNNRDRTSRGTTLLATGPYTALYTPHHNTSARRAAVPRQLSVLRVDELYAPQQHLQPGAVAP